MAKKNFTITTVATAPSPATSGTSLVVAAGTGSLFALNEPAIIFPVNDQPLVANAEIVMVTNVSTDTLTITRTQEGTSARTIVAGDIIIQGITAKDWNDLITLVSGKITAFADPNADRIVFWDDSAGAFAALTASTGLTISGTNMTVRTSSATQTGIVELATTAETETGTDATRAVTPDGLHDMTTLAGASWFLDEDNMASNSAVKTASQQSVKAYVDAKGYTWKGEWVTSTVYAVNDTVEYNGSGYICIVAHTSGTFATDLTNGKWEMFVEGVSADSIASTIHGATAKTTPVDADEVGLIDSAASNVLKKLTWSNIKATLKSYFDSVTTTLTNKTISTSNNVFPGMLDWFYPVGTIYETTSSDLDTVTKMNAHFGGTWEVYGSGRVLVAKSADTEFDTIGETGGAKTHTLSIAEMPSHTHTQKLGGSISTVANVTGSFVIGNANTDTTTATGGGGAHNNLQPYIVVYRYRRTA